MLAGARGTHAATRHVIDAGKEQGDREAASVVTRAAHVQQQSPSWYGAAQHGAAQRGAARRGAAWRGSDWWTHRSAVADRIEDAKAKEPWRWERVGALGSRVPCPTDARYRGSRYTSRDYLDFMERSYEPPAQASERAEAGTRGAMTARFSRVDTQSDRVEVA